MRRVLRAWLSLDSDSIRARFTVIVSARERYLHPVRNRIATILSSFATGFAAERRFVERTRLSPRLANAPGCGSHPRIRLKTSRAGFAKSIFACSSRHGGSRSLCFRPVLSRARVARLDSNRPLSIIASIPIGKKRV